MKRFSAFVACAALLAPAIASAAPLPGTTWLTEAGEAKVTFFACGENDAQLCGALDWLQRQEEAEAPVLDTENPDPDLRSRKLEGITMLWGFKQDDDGAWRGGKLYKPDEGKTYGGNILPQKDGTLKLQGCVLFICKSQIWTRIDS